jgi:hypothetical protein
LEVIASTLLAVPRLLEYAKEYIDVNMLDSNEIRLSKESIQGLYSELFARVVAGYNDTDSIKFPALLKESLLFRKLVVFGDVDARLIQRGFVSGRCPSSKDGQFYLEGSLFMLAALDILSAGLS